ncbi:hypothetical protein [Pseudomonas phage D6]|nr:hypothetical protein [Pseudomonas phage D6]
MSLQCGYSNDSMQQAIERGFDLVLHVSCKGDRSAFLIYVPQKEDVDAAE